MLKKIFRKTFLSWRQMSYKKGRLAVAIAGIAFADLLMFLQLGMKDALFDSQVRPYAILQGDLFIVNKLSDNLNAIKSFSRDNLYQAVGVDGVDSVSFLYIGQANWRNPENQGSRQIFVYGINPNKPAFDLPEVNRQLDQLLLMNNALFDRAGLLPQIGDVPKLLATENPLDVQVNNYKIKITGLFTLGSSFSAEGNLITSDSTFLRLFKRRQANDIDVGIIRLKPNANIQLLQAELKSILPDNLLVLTRDEFADRERTYWANGSPIAYIFGFGVVIGFLVGTVIVYQILYTDVSDHLPEYATLKAMGYSDLYFVRIVLQEAFILATLGFIPGIFISNGLYIMTQSATFLPIAMKLSRAITVLTLTIVMCILSGAIAIQKLRAADPADIF
ncbi:MULTISPECIES: ABC transporter permease DevC [Nostoc]|uniref:FtsX-like permease family protein n=1 Tax=Nostoc paludosum FACHB-159 TaxID=2692908 RepID=A0ABR8KLJ3_9NOSO|nr:MULTISPECIES: ABC transporter permease DevC [Nostoc]MBD2682701.1 FtsX-like permease family protein [Nostoc sp. FACHB-857]MBD2739035.1 FtsX-like permease family protein [Nostoc paludosum FACHB-159]